MTLAALSADKNHASVNANQKTAIVNGAEITQTDNQ